MLKAKAGDMTILGLSKINLRKLKEGKPIYINHPVFGRIFIFYGDTEIKMKKSLESFIGPDTKVTDETH